MIVFFSTDGACELPRENAKTRERDSETFANRGNCSRHDTGRAGMPESYAIIGDSVICRASDFETSRGVAAALVRNLFGSSKSGGFPNWCRFRTPRPQNNFAHISHAILHENF
jgi:hypothetical protein